MALVRKSVVSTKNSWFRKNPPNSPLSQQNPRNLSTNIQNPSKPISETTRVRSRKKANPTRKVSTTLVNKPIISTINIQKESVQPIDANINENSHRHPSMVSTNSVTPIWLLRFHTVYRYSSVIAFLVVAATLMVYGWTVYSQELWNQAYRKLQSLQRHERQLNTTNATLTSKMAKEAEKPATGLLSPTPGVTIFLPSASHNPNSLSSTTIPNSKTQSPSSSPLGY